MSSARIFKSTGIRCAWVMSTCLSVCLLASCSSQIPTSASTGDRPLKVVTTTGILADFARHVGGDHVQVSQLVPQGADPHSWEPSLRGIRDVAYADIAVTNYLMLEQHSLIKTLDANLPADALSVSLAEEAAKQGATILPLVEDRALDTVWLGMRVAGQGRQHGATRASEIDLTVTSVDGPGDAAGYLTTTFGVPEIGFASSDGFDQSTGYAKDTTTLPADAHQHMSWAFTQPGIYTIHVTAALRTAQGQPPIHIGTAKLVCAVGVDAAQVARTMGRQVLTSGHADLTVDLDAHTVDLMVDRTKDGANPLDVPEIPHASKVTGLAAVSLDDVVVDIPTRTLTQVPGQKGFRFLGSPGQDIYLLPQAVLGKHVHGEIDPHLWHDVHNAAAYVRVLRDRFIERDPEHADDYRQNAEEYLRDLEDVDAYMTSMLSSIPQERRHLVTTHDAYGYLANAYGMNVAGFVAPNPAVEPSISDRKKLVTAIKNLKIPAVFLEPQLARRPSTLQTVAAENGIDICPLYGDTLDAEAPTYVDMMRFNARSLARCLGGHEAQQSTPHSPEKRENNV